MIHADSLLNTRGLNELSFLLRFFMVFGVVASSISGALRAIESKMDITGAILLAFVMANAGGSIRDLALGTIPFWINDQFYVWLSLTAGLATFVLVYYNHKIFTSRILRNSLMITDAMGLATFSLGGVEKALSFGYSGIIAIIMGVCTAIGGGVIADVIANRIPLVFSQELYMSVAALGSCCYLLLTNIFGVNHIVASVVIVILMFLLRLYSIKYDLRLPIIK